MRIALISLHFSEYAYRLARSLAENNEVLLIVGQENFEHEMGCVPHSTQAPRLKIVSVPRRPLKNPLVVLNALKILIVTHRFRPDVIHCQEDITDYLIWSLLFLKKYPLVLTIHDHIPHTGHDSQENIRKRKYRIYQRKHADAVIVHGERIRAECESIHPWLRGKVTPIPHGPLGNVEKPVEYGWETGTLLFFGRIEEYKGLKYLIDAIRLLKEQACPVHAIIAGKGRDLDAHRKTILEDPALELLERYINNDETALLFARANIVVLPYTDATQSGVAAMAMRYGRPIIASDVGSIREVVRHGFNGLLVPPRDSVALAAAIRTLVEDSHLAVQFGKNAISLVENELSWPAIAEQTIEVYRRARHTR